MSASRPSLKLAVIASVLTAGFAVAQPAPPRSAPPASPRDAAPIDLTGQWVAIVNEDWRWRMVTPPKGDYASVPLNDEGRRVGMRISPAAPYASHRPSFEASHVSATFRAASLRGTLA